jgi:hypothetical protein
MQVSTVNSSKP